MMDAIPIPMTVKNPYLDILTFVFCGAMILLTINCTIHRKQFKSVLQALFVPRVRNQLLREGKIFNEWVYIIAIVFIFLVQSAFVYLLLCEFLPKIALRFTPLVLYNLSLVAVIADYFLKMLSANLLAYIFDYSSARNTLNLNKFFYLTVNSVALFPILIITVYTHTPVILLAYIPIFLSSYMTMIYRSLTLNINIIHPFHFFLYFCTLEILPYLIYLKLLITYANLIN
ncbi:MAG: DUF4271 domain-containing protein [Bacteroidales bacterium]|jgi:hypothetical protein|nr:DUF4271 domain-containing protein [Bacteroidales bacterium]